MLVLDQAPAQVLVLAPAPERGPALEMGLELQALAQEARVWAPDQEQARVRVALGLVAPRQRTALGLVMEPATMVSARQTEQASAPATALVRAGLAPAPAASNLTPFNPFRDSPHPNLRRPQ